MLHLVAARAGASKETLYRHFGNKEELFADIVRRRSARITGGGKNIFSPNAGLAPKVPLSG
ncbi:MAG: TetR/AcrR family transcriptional regulator [Methylocella sp.]